MLKLQLKDKPTSAVWLVEPKVTIGSKAGHSMVISQPGIGPHHMDILVDGEKLVVRPVSIQCKILVNQTPVSGDTPIKAGDLIQLGEAVRLQVVDPKQQRSNGEQASPKKAATHTGWALKANHSALKNKLYTLAELTVIGRSTDCDICLAASHLSRRHAELAVRDGVLYVKDLGSANGTYVNGEKVTERRLRRGDDLRLDTLSFGVIGPSDEEDKTTIRSALPEMKAAADSAGQRSAERVNRTASASNPHKVEVGTQGVTSEEEDSSSNLGLIVGIVVGIVVLAAAGWFFLV